MAGQGVGAAEQEELLESGVRLSESQIWQMLEQYFLDQGVAAWEQVPYYITNNTFIAETYAELIIAFLLDQSPYLDLQQPLYVVELAAGMACFSYFLVQELAVRLPRFRRLRDLRLVYVVTDFTEVTVAWQERRPQFAPLLAAGQVDFAVFRPEHEDRLWLRHGKQWLAPGTPANPLIAIANYCFDTLRHDIFGVYEGALLEATYTFYRGPGRESDTGPFERLRYDTQYVIAGPDRYADPVLNEILRHYGRHLTDAGILFPVGAFSCLRNLRAMAGGKLVLLASDKGFAAMEDMEGHGEPTYEVQGSLSFGLNFDALCRFVRGQGGVALATNAPNLPLVTMLGAWPSLGDLELEQTRYYFQQRLEAENPINYLYYSQYLVNAGTPPSARNELRGLLALLHLSNCDPVAFGRCGERLFNLLSQMKPLDRQQLIEVLDRVYGHFYPTENQYNPMFWLGRIYFELRLFPQAGVCFQYCIDLHPDAPSAYYNLGLVQQELKKPDQAAWSYRTYVALAPAAADVAEVWQRIRALAGSGLGADAPGQQSS